MQRPTSVTVFGVLNIVFGVLGLLVVLFSGAAVFLATAQRQRLPGMEEMNPVLATWTKVSVVIGLLGTLALLISGMGLLGLKSWGRFLAMGYSVYTIVTGILGIVVQYVFVIQPVLEQQVPGGRREVVIGTVIGGAVGSCIGLIYPVLLMFFMSRPHVKAAFSGVYLPDKPVPGYAPSPNAWSPADAANPYAASQVTAPPPYVGSGSYSAPESIIETFVPARNGPALVAYYCGIFSLFPCLGFPLGVVAVYYGLKGLRMEKENPAVRGGIHAWVGVICGALFGLFNLLLCAATIMGIIVGITHSR